MTDIASALTRTGDIEVEHTSWGRLEWMVSASIGNSETMTAGRCYLDPGQANPRHYHPNCDEVLHVLDGTIEHTLADQTIPMTAGDTISIPRNTLHNARNTGNNQAVLVITFSSAHRETIGED